MTPCERVFALVLRYMWNQYLYRYIIFLKDRGTYKENFSYSKEVHTYINGHTTATNAVVSYIPYDSSRPPST